VSNWSGERTGYINASRGAARCGLCDTAARKRAKTFPGAEIAIFDARCRRNSVLPNEEERKQGHNERGSIVIVHLTNLPIYGGSRAIQIPVFYRCIDHPRTTEHSLKPRTSVQAISRRVVTADSNEIVARAAALMSAVSHGLRPRMRGTAQAEETGTMRKGKKYDWGDCIQACECNVGLPFSSLQSRDRRPCRDSQTHTEVVFPSPKHISLPRFICVSRR
jgi:hypothetical protein